jgi:hypothetical protein
MEQIKQVFTTPDGKQFDTRADAANHLRRPKVEAALMPLANKDKKLVDWLIDNQETIEVAFEVGTIRRVTKSERNKLTKAIDHIVEKMQGDSKAAFFLDNAESIKETFRWPSVQRMSDEEKAVAARNTLMNATENNEKLVTWVLGNKDNILAAYNAGVEKREVSPKATEALAAYREKMAAKKAAEAAEKGDEPEATSGGEQQKAA